VRKQICANCHFLTRQYHGERGAEHIFTVDAVQRKQVAQGDLSWQRESESIACSKGIWDEGLGMSRPVMAAAISQQNRRGKCYYFEHQPGMLIPAAEKLQQEQTDFLRERFKNRLVIYGLATALVGLIIKMVYDKAA